MFGVVLCELELVMDACRGACYHSLVAMVGLCFILLTCFAFDGLVLCLLFAVVVWVFSFLLLGLVIAFDLSLLWWLE